MAASHLLSIPLVVIMQSNDNKTCRRDLVVAWQVVTDFTEHESPLQQLWYEVGRGPLLHQDLDVHAATRHTFPLRLT